MRYDYLTIKTKNANINKNYTFYSIHKRFVLPLKILSDLIHIGWRSVISKAIIAHKPWNPWSKGMQTTLGQSSTNSSQASSLNPSYSSEYLKHIPWSVFCRWRKTSKKQHDLLKGLVSSSFSCKRKKYLSWTEGSKSWTTAAMESRWSCQVVGNKFS